MERLTSLLAALLAVLVLASPATARPADDKAERAAKAEKARREKLEKAKAAYKKKLLKSLGDKEEGHFLFVLEEAVPQRVVGVTAVAKEGRDAAADEIAGFMVAADKTRRSFQVLARFEANDAGAKLVKAHQEKLQGFINVRLQDRVFSLDNCYSDLDPADGKSINQKVAEGTCVIYRPFR
jgi:hypothetical protein